LASRRNRADQLEKMMADVQQQHDDHHAGVRELHADELDRVERKLQLYQRKMDELRAIPDEREIERMLKREELIRQKEEERKQRRVEL